jgi:hypothetical protein
MTVFFVGKRVFLYVDKTTTNTLFSRKGGWGENTSFLRIFLDVGFRLQKPLGGSRPQRANQHALVSRHTGAASRATIFSWG